MNEYDHITTETIEQDIKDTERELKDDNDLLEVLNRNPVTNKVQIYLTQGKAMSRTEFIKKLNSILDFRKGG